MGLFARIRDIWRDFFDQVGTATTEVQVRAAFADPKIWRTVVSSNVDAIAWHYDYGTRMGYLAVRFQGTAKGIREPVYIYVNVPVQVWTDFMAATSKGKFVWRRLRGKYDFDGPLRL